MTTDDTPEKADQRYRKFISDIAETNLVWGLHNGEGWAQWHIDDDAVMPLWSQKSATVPLMEKAFSDYQPRAMSIAEFREELLPFLSEDEIWIGVNLTSEMTGVEVPVDELETDLIEAGI